MVMETVFHYGYSDFFIKDGLTPLTSSSWESDV